MKLKAASHSARRLLAAWLSLALTGAPMAHAAEKKGQPYFTKCVDLFKSIGIKPIEEVFLAQIENQDQMRQLLYDYNLLLTKHFYSAVALNLEKRGMDLRPRTTARNRPPTQKELVRLRTYILELQKIAKDREQLRALVWEVSETLLALPGTALQESTVTPDRVQWEQKRQLFAAIKASPQKAVFEAEMMELVEQVLLSSALELVQTWANWNKIWVVPSALEAYEYSSSSGASAWVGGLSAFAVSLTVLLSVDWNNSPQDVAIAGGSLVAISSFVSAFVAYMFDDGGGPSAAMEALSVYKKIRQAYALAFRRPPKIDSAQQNSYADFEPTREKVSPIWEGLSSSAFASETALSIEAACEKNLCAMTPVQIAYVGHLDLMRLKLLEEKLMAAFSGDKSLSQSFESLADQARALEANAGSYATQAAFIQNFRLILQQLQVFEADMTLHRRSIQERSEAVAKTLEKLRQLPYAHLTAGGGEPEIAKGELLTARLETDLATLESIKLNSRALDKKGERLVAAILQLMELEKAFPKSRNSTAWEKTAQDVLILVDQIRASQIGVSK